MATGTGSLADAFASSGIKEVTVEPVNDVSNNDNPTEIVIAPPTNPAAPNFDAFAESEPKDEPTPETGNEGGEPTEGSDTDDVNYIQQFAQELGIEGEVEGNSFDALVNIGKQAISQYKEKLEFYETTIDPKLVEHIKAGGNIESYLSYPQETNYYQDAKFEEDDVENRELLVKDFYANQGIEEDQAEMLINSLKDKGTFNAFSDKVLDQYKTLEKAENEKIASQRKADEETAIKQHNEFLAGIKDGFEKGLKGVVVDKDILEEAKRVSLPDAKGVIGFHSIKLTPEQEATVNTLIVALSKGKSFQYSPTKAAVKSAGEKPIHSIFGKQTTSGNNTQKLNSLEDMNDFFSKAK